MSIENHSDKPVKSTFMIERAKEYIKQDNLKEAVISLASDINNISDLKEFQKKVLIGIAMNYQSKKKLSRVDVDMFIEYIKVILDK